MDLVFVAINSVTKYTIIKENLSNGFKSRRHGTFCANISSGAVTATKAHLVQVKGVGTPVFQLRLWQTQGDKLRLPPV